MEIGRLTLAGSLCVALVACATHDSGEISVPPSVGFSGPVPSGGFGGTVGGIAGGAAGFGRGPGGEPVRLTELQTAERPPRPISGGTLAVAADGSYAVAADPDRDMLYIVKTDTLAVTKVNLPAESDPGRVVVDPGGRAHVVLRGGGKLVRIDLASGSIAGEAAVCARPRGLAHDAARNRVVAGCMDGHVVMLEAADYAEVSRTFVAQDLRDVVAGSNGRFFVSRYRSAELIVLDGAGAVQASTRPRQAHAQRLAGPIPPVVPAGIVDPQHGGGFGLRDVTFSPALAWRTAAGPNGQVWMLHQESMDDAVAPSPGGYGGACAPITKGAVTRFSPDGTPLMMSGVALLGTSVDLAASPAGEWVAVASPGGYLSGSQTLQLYSSAAMTDDMNQDFCSGPHLVAGTTGQVVGVAFDGAGLLYTFSREPAELEILSITAAPAAFHRIATVTLDRRSVRDTGHELFHTDVGSGLSCASCHGEALDDGHVWTFDGIGPRRTQNMRGGLLATAPFHWDGDMTSFKKLVDDVMTGRMGGFPVSEVYAEALARWIDAQPALLLPGAPDGAAAARGKALFHGEATACATCHAGDALTNNESADVGTGGSFQVPSLRGLGLRGPYMHDGCAKTLEARFDPACGGGDLHGKTSHLSREQIADLSAYLSTL